LIIIIYTLILQNRMMYDPNWTFLASDMFSACVAIVLW